MVLSFRLKAQSQIHTSPLSSALRDAPDTLHPLNFVTGSTPRIFVGSSGRSVVLRRGLRSEMSRKLPKTEGQNRTMDIQIMYKYSY